MAIMSYLSAWVFGKALSEPTKTPGSKANQWAVAVVWYVDPRGPDTKQGRSVPEKTLGGLPPLRLISPTGGTPDKHSEPLILGHPYENPPFSHLGAQCATAKLDLSALVETELEPNALYVHSVFSPCENCANLLIRLVPHFPRLTHRRFSYNYLWHTDNHPNGIHTTAKALEQLHHVKEAGFLVRSFPPGGTKAWFPSTIE